MEVLDLTKIITKGVFSSDNKHVGHVDGFDDANLIVKDGLIKPRYYIIPRDSIEGYEEGKVVLRVSDHDIKMQFRRKNPGYFEDLT